MQLVITNTWAQLYPGNVARNAGSRVAVEATGPVEYAVERPDPREVVVVLRGAECNQPAGTVPVHDGLIQSFSVQPRAAGGVELRVRLEHPAPFHIATEQGLPWRLVVDFDRSAIQQILQGRVIGIDAGHGGRDHGYRGPVNLLEKNKTLAVTKRLAQLLSEVGAIPVLTRGGDQTVCAEQRRRALLAQGAEVAVSVHMGGAADRRVRGIRTVFRPHSSSSRLLGERLHRALTAKLALADRGLHGRAHGLCTGLSIPAAEVEVCAITNPVEEAYLRSPTFISRAAQALFNGLKDFLGETLPPFAVRRIPLKTHIVTPGEDLVELVRRYAGRVADRGDVVVLAESMVAIAQGRAYLPQSVRPGLLAHILSRFANKDGSLGTAPAAQLAIDEVGRPRILLAAAAAAAGKLLGRRGDFFRVAGPEVSWIDDIGGTLPPFDGHIVLGPAQPQRVVDAIKHGTGLDAAIVDADDIGHVSILAATNGVEHDLVRHALVSNPCGNDDQQTPLLVIKKNQLVREEIGCHRAPRIVTMPPRLWRLSETTSRKGCIACTCPGTTADAGHIRRSWTC